MPTLIVPDRPSNTDVQKLRGAALDIGWEVVATRYRLPDDWKPQDPVLYGDPMFCDLVAAQLGERLIEPAVDFLLQLPENWRRREVSLSTLEEARKTVSIPTFVKPALDKSFPATVYRSGADLPDELAAPGDTRILLSEPVRWEVEWRLFVGSGQIVSHSPYFRHGLLDFKRDPAEQREALDFGRQLLSEIEPLLPPTVVVDIGKLEGDGWAVVEANPSWASGLYQCDPGKTLPAIWLATVPVTTDVSWLRPALDLE